MPKPPLVLTSCNRKGGCFKTSSIFHLAGAYAASGSRVLLLDLDPQASLSQTFFGSVKIEELDPNASIAGLFDDARPAAPEDVIFETHLENIWIAPACDQLGDYNLPKPHEQGLIQDVIAQLIMEVGDSVDVVLIDTPPNLQLLTWAAMAASDFVITPVIPEQYASQGLVHVRRFIEAVVQTKRPSLRWLGLVLAMVQSRVSIHKSFEEKLREGYGDLVFNQTIPLATVFKESVLNKTPVTQFQAKSAGAKALDTLHSEITSRIATPAIHELQKAA